MSRLKASAFRIGIGWMLLALLAAACVPAATPTPGPSPTPVVVERVVTPTPTPPGPVTITFWHAYNPEETKVFNEQVLPAFHQKFPNIRVEAQQVPYDEFRRKLLTSIAGGTAPDVIRADIIWVPELAAMGALEALDVIMPDFNAYKEKVFPGPLSTNFWQGHYYGLPLDTNTRLLMWNKEMYAAAGIAEPPKTIDEFLKVCERIKALGKDKYCFADGGTYGWAVLPWIWSFGGDLTDPEMKTASGYVNGPDTVAAYEFLKGMLDKGYLHPGILGGGVDTAGGFARDEIANLLEGPWMPAIFAAQYPQKQIQWALMPAGKGGSISVVGGEDIVLFKQSRNKEAALEFIRFMLSPETQLMMARVGQVPVRTDVIQQAVQAQPYFALFFEQLKTARARLPHPNWPKIEDLLTSTGQAILRGEKGAKEALDELAPKIDALLKQQ
ncbi:MAG TPA: extracellular solute-binding protein [Thermoflexus sp.]|nr:extracellular solute-binding protein [Thermoflexus sp.]